MLILVFVLLWTASTLAIAIAFSLQATGWLWLAVWIFPVIGAGCAYLAWLQMRRRRSLRLEVIDGVTFHVWIDLNGQEKRSTADPTPDWDANDGDGDGGGGD